MLEYEDWGIHDAGHEEGYQTGRQTTVLETMIRLYRTRHKAPGKEGSMKFLVYCCFYLFAKEQLMEFLDFVKRYPRMPPEKLAERIMKESEYIYGMEKDGGFS